MMESSPEYVKHMPFIASGGFIIHAAIFLEFLVVLLAFEVEAQLVHRLGKDIDCELGEVDVVTKGVIWVQDADGKVMPPLPEYSVVDSTPPPPYKDDVDLGIFVVELGDDDDE
jgi:hypothetical protein